MKRGTLQCCITGRVTSVVHFGSEGAQNSLQWNYAFCFFLPLCDGPFVCVCRNSERYFGGDARGGQTKRRNGAEKFELGCNPDQINYEEEGGWEWHDREDVRGRQEACEGDNKEVQYFEVDGSGEEGSHSATGTQEACEPGDEAAARCACSPDQAGVCRVG